MHIRKITKGMRRVIAVFTSAAAVMGYVQYIKVNVPDTIYLDSYSGGTIDMEIPFVGTALCHDESQAVTASVNLMEPVVFSSGNASEHEVALKLFGIWDVKHVTVSVGESRQVVACGIPVGIYIETDGILVVDVGEVETGSRTIEAPAKGILKPGDYIESVNGKTMDSINTLVETISECSDYAVIGIRRDGECIEVKIKPVKDGDGKGKIGVWVRDDCQGLGTLTYVDDKGDFGTLGHAISDSSTGQMVEIKSGSLYTAHIWSVVKGESGTPGEVIGSINYGDDCYLGDIEDNCKIGVYGKADEKVFAYVDEVYLPIAYKQDIKKGDALIRTFVGGDVKDYHIDIEEVHFAESYENKGIVFKVTDKELLEATNGIVQGMSGSPIIQDGKVIGAVTHVFVNEPDKGYGIFIENMLEH
ncbi:MAG: SpoIVB peptidase [Butyrivibrio sp.]